MTQCIRMLTRACHRQALVSRLWGGLFSGIVAASVIVAIARLTGVHSVSDSGVALLVTVSACIAGGLGIAVLLSWRSRASSLDVAIVSDLKLNLRQRLSTAWEFAQSSKALDADESLVGRLAQQAVAARLPRRANQVFSDRDQHLGQAHSLGRGGAGVGVHLRFAADGVVVAYAR